MSNDLALKISVIICAYTENRWDDLKAAVKSVKEQTQQPLEIIIVIDHNPKLFERAQDNFPDVIVIENQGVRGLSDARNSGITASRGEMIAFMDEDAYARPDWLARLSVHYQDTHVAGVGGLVEPDWVAKKPAWFPIEFNWVVGCSYRGLPETLSVVRNMIGCNMSLRREVFEKVGGFRSGIGRVGTIPLGCEETELCIRASQGIENCLFLHEPQARVSHRVPAQRGKFSYFVSRCYAEGLSKALVTRLVGQTGLSSETSYTMKTLPQGAWQGVKDAVFHLDLSGIGRASAIIVGFGTTAVGYMVGKVAMLNPANSGTAENKGLSIDARINSE